MTAGGLSLPCGCTWTPGIDLPTTECAAHAESLSARDRRAITQRTGARVRSLKTGQRGAVEGHYDDDSVYVRMDGGGTLERWWVDDLRVVTAEAAGSAA